MTFYNCLNIENKICNVSHHGGGGYWMKGAMGLLSLIFTVGLLYKNEEVYDNVSKIIVELSSIDVIDSGNEGKLVYLKGRIEVNEPLTEPEYGVTIAAVKLKRRVQMYQWVEVQQDISSWWNVPMDSNPPISYINTWKDRLVDSSLFVNLYGHANPKSFPVESGVSVSEIVKLGAFSVSRELKDKFNTFILLTSDQRPDRRDIKMHSGLYYHSFDVWNPEVGDTRVQLSYAGASDDVVTILAHQVGDMLLPYSVGGKEITSVLEGEHSLSAILASKFPSTGVWLIRIPAYLAVYCAYSSLTQMICKTGKHNRLIHVLVNSNRCVLCHTLSAATVLTTLAVAWFPHSPLLGSINLLASFFLLLFCLFKAYSFYYYLGR